MNPRVCLSALALGLLSGVALAVVLCFVLATTLWQDGRWRQAPIGGFGELGAVVALQVPLAVAALSGVGVLYLPLASLLLLAAVGVVGSLMLVAVVLLRYGDRVFESSDQLQVPATVALLLGIGVMAAFAGGRFLLERLTGAPPLT